MNESFCQSLTQAGSTHSSSQSVTLALRRQLHTPASLHCVSWVKFANSVVQVMQFHTCTTHTEQPEVNLTFSCVKVAMLCVNMQLQTGVVCGQLTSGSAASAESCLQLQWLPSKAQTAHLAA